MNGQINCGTSIHGILLISRMNKLLINGTLDESPENYIERKKANSELHLYNILETMVEMENGTVMSLPEVKEVMVWERSSMAMKWEQ